MAIRQRLKQSMPKPEYRAGVPDLLFEGFRWRFGHIAAVFINAKMQSISGLADPMIAKHPLMPTAAFLFASKGWVEREIVRRKESRLNYDFLEQVLADWPEGKIPSRLEHRIDL